MYVYMWLLISLSYVATPDYHACICMEDGWLWNCIYLSCKL